MSLHLKKLSRTVEETSDEENRLILEGGTREKTGSLQKAR